ncbi:MAG TPA: NYN domain-containing protein [Acidimicrobiales bacterium]|jgi:uncharacterized LabA/DUF88 family protein|nr:NYN domain-containing protein [Actinomycetes bacterium]MDP6104548.1 NYN domain-containing protein [Acidimicrobiales bacterium]MCP4845901.1 NYN domain-containing protein [Actinomycetes bacterium]MDP6241595.1 NYN domain-containing protein [Acidimicrobiales bacterium]MDP7124541.1 NYN domain-containing protein [Acidimicrobiales bacterium]|tara:strand:- start:6942 stop:7973 length:1032 start_codon:yes stop_codon:yes gene_type:complete
MRTDSHEERIGVFLDYENLAIGARESLGLKRFDFGPIARAMAERGRVVYRRAYADWSGFDEDRRHLARHQVELIEIPQRMGTSRKNAADIKMVVDALELAFERAFVTTIVICTGDSDFTPLVQKLRELDRRVIGIGVRDSTSKLLPPACDEFLFYDSLEGVEAVRDASGKMGGDAVDGGDDDGVSVPAASLDELVISTLAGMQGSGEDVRASTLKRAIQRIDPTFSEADHGFRGFTELLRHLADRQVVEVSGTKRDPDVDLVTGGGPSKAAFDLLVEVVGDAGKKGAVMSGLKTELRRRNPDFSERAIGYGGFLQFCKAAAARDLVAMAWDDKRGDYLLSSTT